MHAYEKWPLVKENCSRDQRIKGERFFQPNLF
jgi:hypothetical protein